MTELNKLLKKLRNAEKKEDLDKLDKVRQQIIEEHGEAPEAAEARYRLGLSMLLRHGNLQQAETLFVEATRSSDQLFAPMARISYALMLHAQKKEQKALFELRKVVGSRKATPQSVVALAFIVTVLRDMGAKPDEVKRARKQQIEQLMTLVGETDDDALRAQLLLQLGLAQLDHKDPEEAKHTLQQALELSVEADPEIHQEARAALKTLEK